MVHDHFKEYRGHTAIKHAILKDYIGACAGILDVPMKMERLKQ